MNETNNSSENAKPNERKLLKLPEPSSQPDHPLAFSKEGHDQKIEARMSEEAKSKCRALISRAYVEWKRILQRKISRAQRNPNDPAKQLSQQDIIASVYELHDIVGKQARTPEMFEWRSFTLGLLEDLIGTIIMTQFKKNLFTEYLPENKATEALVVPQRHAFETFDEFEAIPFLQKFKEKAGFVGFLREQRQILALFKDGETVMIGVVTSPLGVEKLPTRFQMMKALEKDEQP